MELLENLKMSLLNVNFIKFLILTLIYIIHKMLVLPKIHLNYIKDNILRRVIDFFLFIF